MAEPSSRERVMITPEGLSLPLTLASRGARLGALVIDLTLIVLALIAVMVALIFTLSREHPTRWMCALAAALTLVAALASGLRRTSLRPQDR